MIFGSEWEGAIETESGYIFPENLSCIKKLMQEYEKCPQSILDFEIRKKVAKATLTAKRLVSNFQNSNSGEQAVFLHSWFAKEFASEIQELPVMKRKFQ